MISRKTGVLLALAVAFGGCAELDTTNLNDPDAARALSQPGDVESLIGSGFLNWFDATQGTTPALAMSTVADEGSASWGNFGMQQTSSEPRAAFPNSTGFGYSSFLTSPWYDMYSVISAMNDGLNAIEDGMQFGDDGEDTPRAEAFAKLMQGLAHGWLALQFDQAFIFTEDDDLLTTDFQLVPYTEVMAAAIGMLDEAASLAQAGSFSTPDNWIGGEEYSSAELARIAKSYSARLLAGVARTPEERAAVNWQDVITRVDAGITADFGPTLDNTDWEDDVKDFLTRPDWMRADYRLVGPADVSGNYQAWLATPVADRTPFDITTPDRRITGDSPDSDGLDFEYRFPQDHRADRGTYHFSRYHSARYAVLGDDQIGFDPILTVAEMDLLKAEAYIRTNQAALAVPLINDRRTTRGQLPPVTVDGPPQADDCVPQTETGDCGNLMDALIYEKRIETFSTGGGLSYIDARGWGYLVEGTPIHYPIPARELETLNMPAYTFGGVGGPGAAK
jgi:hypothetical protein